MSDRDVTKADEQPGLEVGDLIVVLHELEHPRFRRRDADLFMKLDISLAEVGIVSSPCLAPLTIWRLLFPCFGGPGRLQACDSAFGWASAATGGAHGAGGAMCQGEAVGSKMP